jgi:hypothetical protein
MDQPRNLIGIHMTTVWLADSATVKNAMLRLQQISMRGCCVKADEILTMLSRAYAPRVEVLDLSRNQCTEQFKTALSLPATLSKLIMDDVKWNYNNFITLFKLICNSAQAITFSCVHVQMNDRHLNKFFQAIEACQAPQLLVLIWNDNPVHTKLCQLLLKAPNLKVLCIAGSRVLSDAALQRLLSEHRTLYIIDMHGTAVNRFGPALKGFLTAIKKSKSIRRIDVSHNKMGTQAFTRLVELIISNPKIRQVLLDDNDLPSYASFEPLLQAIQGRERPFYCRYPEEDIQFFNRTENFSEEKIAAIRAKFRPPESPLKGPGHEEWLKLIYQNYPESSEIEEAKQPIPKPDIEEVVRPESEDLTRNVANDGHSTFVSTGPAGSPGQSMEQQSRAMESGQGSNRLNSHPVSSPVFNGHAAFRPPASIQMDFVDVPPIDNTQIYGHYKTVYSVQTLTQRLRSLI